MTPDVLPVFRRVVVEGQQRIPVLDQFGDRLVPFHAIGFDEEVESGVRLGFCLSLPDVVQRECHELCVSGLAHAGFRYGHALKRSSNMIAN